MKLYAHSKYLEMDYKVQDEDNFVEDISLPVIVLL